MFTINSPILASYWKQRGGGETCLSRTYGTQVFFKHFWSFRGMEGWQLFPHITDNFFCNKMYKNPSKQCHYCLSHAFKFAFFKQNIHSFSKQLLAGHQVSVLNFCEKISTWSQISSFFKRQYFILTEVFGELKLWKLCLHFAESLMLEKLVSSSVHNSYKYCVIGL